MTANPTPSDLLASLRRAIEAQDDDLAEHFVRRLTTADGALVAELVTWLDDPDTDRRWWGARTLVAVAGLAGDGATALDPLRKRLRDDDASIRCAAALALAELGLVEATDDLVETLSDVNGWVRASAADALALMGEKAVPALATVLATGPQGARSRAAHALSKIRTLETAEVFYRYLQDENQLVQAYAYDTLDQMGFLRTILVV